VRLQKPPGIEITELRALDASRPDDSCDAARHRVTFSVNDAFHVQSPGAAAAFPSRLENAFRCSPRPCMTGLGDERAAWWLFEKRPVESYSFTDGTSFILMSRERVTTAVALDHQFSHEGFVVVPSETSGDTTPGPGARAGPHSRSDRARLCYQK
jgi:hypothetical protein